jgi:undecaprenyl diphosphate synthase
MIPARVRPEAAAATGDIQTAIRVMAPPRHISIIMDGNGRWATQRGLPRAAGHREGVRTLRGIVEHCIRIGVRTLSVFAFSSENWSRPRDEVGLLIDLFMTSLHEQLDALHEHGVRLRFIGNLDPFPAALRRTLRDAEQRTGANEALLLVVAANYGGRWDLARACRTLARRVRDAELPPEEIDEHMFGEQLSLARVPPPDLFIRTGGEQRLSNYLLWDLAYSELYFTDVPWPEFTPSHLDQALEWYSRRQRRFGGLADRSVSPRDR